MYAAIVIVIIGIGFAVNNIVKMQMERIEKEDAEDKQAFKNTETRNVEFDSSLYKTVIKPTEDKKKRSFEWSSSEPYIEKPIEKDPRPKSRKSRPSEELSIFDEIVLGRNAFKPARSRFHISSGDDQYKEISKLARELEEERKRQSKPPEFNLLDMSTWFGGRRRMRGQRKNRRIRRSANRNRSIGRRKN